MVFGKQLALNLVDKITLLYLSVVSILIIIFHSNLPNYIYHLFFHIFFFTGLLIFFYISDKFNLKLLRDWYPLIIVSFLYKETGYLNQMIFKGFWDIFIATLEFKLFGYDFGFLLLSKFYNVVINEIMYFSYFSYYIMIPILGFLIYFKDRVMFHKFLFSIMFTYYVCYILYIFIPIAGPFEMEQIKIKGFIFDKIIHFFYKHGELPGSAMPSSHVAIALIVLIYSKITKNFFKIFLMAFLCLSISTMYLRYHYFLDVEAGIITGIVCYYLSCLIMKKYKLLSKENL